MDRADISDILNKRQQPMKLQCCYQNSECCQGFSSSTGEDFYRQARGSACRKWADPAPCTCHVTAEAAVTGTWAEPQEPGPHRNVRPQYLPATNTLLNVA